MASEACLANPGSCDDYMIPYCSKLSGKTDPTCACINSKLNGSSYLPICSDQACINGGYITKNMATSVLNGCPTIVNCNQYATYISSGLITNIDPSQTQSCSSNGVTKTTSGSTQQGTGTTTAIPSQYISIGAILLIGALIYFFVLR